MFISKNRNAWSQDEIEFIKNNYLKMSDFVLSQFLVNHSEISIATKRKRMDLIRSKKKYNFQDIKKAFAKTDYILVSDDKDYVDMATKSIKYICPKHKEIGIQVISPGHFLNGEGCRICGREKSDSARRIDLDNYTKGKIICESKGFEYVDTIRKDQKGIYIKFICPKHRNVGIQEMKLGNMKRDNIKGCKYCLDTKKFKYSKGELEIKSFLDNHNISYIAQYEFPDCKDILLLPFDFFLPVHNVCIEYDGQHHFKPVCFNGISKEEAELNHEATIKHDRIKTQYCVDNNIGLIRIPYYNFKMIDKILNDKLNCNYD